ncbi:hypothetical protein [Singulisphaera sp. GP187]|uniref:hypothetical protein n=1 Tax=Singulisphaera sp. GP187 TaxID=1882752 RepID=UPI0009412A8E|nr:hypothetical protein [Singulisphaera sp. GP187]
MRLAIDLACHPDQVVSADEISRSFAISRRLPLAQQAFLSVLDQFRREQLLTRRSELVTLLDNPQRRGARPENSDEE